MDAIKRLAWIFAAAGCAGALTGCVERRYVVFSDPPGALVLRNGQPIGQTPVDDHFVYYGNYHFTLIKDGYETQQIDQQIRPPWYEWFPIEFFGENLWPWKVMDRRTFTYPMQPRQVPDATTLRNQAENLRNRGRSLGAGTPPETTPPAISPPPATSPSPAMPPVP